MEDFFYRVEADYGFLLTLSLMPASCQKPFELC